MAAVLLIFAALMMGTLVMRLLALPVMGAPGTWVTSLGVAASGIAASVAAARIAALLPLGGALPPGGAGALVLALMAAMLVPVIRTFLRDETGAAPGWGQAAALAALYVLASVLLRLALRLAAA